MAGDRYCQPGDLVLGTTRASDADLDKYVNEAADEIDARLGETYVLPLAPSDVTPSVTSWQQLQTHVKLYLKRCNVLLASGRFLMAASSRGQEGEDAYATYLLREGEMLLSQLVTGQVNLGAVKVESLTDSATGPTIFVGDTTSGVDHFYDFVSEDPRTNVGIAPTPWRPGVTS